MAGLLIGADSPSVDIIAMAWDEKSSGTTAGSSVADWEKRFLNSQAETVSGGGSFSLVTSGTSAQISQFTLGAGTWLIRWSVPSFADAGSSGSRLISSGSDGTSSEVLKYGSSGKAHSSGAEVVLSLGQHIHSPAALNYYYIEHRTTSAVSNGWGAATSFQPEVYMQVIMYKLN